MSLIVTVWTPEGIVMGSDSRLSFESKNDQNITKQLQTGHFFDTQEKTFICSNNCGISTCGAASLQGKNITGFIYKYINEQVTPLTSVYETADNLKNYITSIDSDLEVHFIVSGYDSTNNQKTLSVYYIVTGNKNICELISTEPSGVKYDGETATMKRIFEANFICLSPYSSEDVTLNINGESQYIGEAYILPFADTIELQKNIICWNLMTLQDAIDFIRYAINVTVETMKFLNVNKTVGGPIDILVITPEKADWISHKELH